VVGAKQVEMIRLGDSEVWAQKTGILGDSQVWLEAFKGDKTFQKYLRVTEFLREKADYTWVLLNALSWGGARTLCEHIMKIEYSLRVQWGAHEVDCDPIKEEEEGVQNAPPSLSSLLQKAGITSAPVREVQDMKNIFSDMSTLKEKTDALKRAYPPSSRIIISKIITVKPGQVRDSKSFHIRFQVVQKLVPDERCALMAEQADVDISKEAGWGHAAEVIKKEVILYVALPFHMPAAVSNWTREMKIHQGSEEALARIEPLRGKTKTEQLVYLMNSLLPRKVDEMKQQQQFQQQQQQFQQLQQFQQQDQQQDQQMKPTHQQSAPQKPAHQQSAAPQKQALQQPALQKPALQKSTEEQKIGNPKMNTPNDEEEEEEEDSQQLYSKASDFPWAQQVLFYQQNLSSELFELYQKSL
jgi:hypothetical protein